jgi:hypothetical protein
VNDVKDLLNLALSDRPAPAEPADPHGDLERGRSLLRRRRLLGLAGVTAAMAVGALVPVALQSSGAPASHPAAVHHAGAQTGKPRAASPSASGSSRSIGSIALVAWRGTQPPGYLVSWMPSGWQVQGSTPYALTIAPAGDPDTNPDSFLGKLVVMLQSADAPSLPPGASQPVNARPGIFQTAAQAGGNTEILTFQVAGGHWVQVQAPMTLGWDSTELAKFASGVQVLAAAQPGHG